VRKSSMDKDRCHGLCKEHGEQCIASIKPFDVKRANEINKMMCGTSYIVRKNVVLGHTHRCKKCLEEYRERENKR